MTYERLDEVLGRLRVTRDTQKAVEEQKRQAALEAATEFARIKAEVIGPVFVEITAHLAARGFSGEIIDQMSDATSPIALIVDLSDDDRSSQKESLRIVSIRKKECVDLIVQKDQLATYRQMHWDANIVLMK